MALELSWLRACRPGNRLEVRRAALSGLQEARAEFGVASWSASGTQPVLSLWPGLHAGVSLDGTRYGWTIPGFPGEVATCPADDECSAARRIAGRLDELTGVAGWLA